MLNDNIVNQMNATTQEIVNDNGELIYKYMWCLQFDLTQNMLNKIIYFESFVDYEDDDSSSKKYSHSKNQFEKIGNIVGRNSTAVWNGQ